MQLVDVYRARVVDVSADSLVIETTGTEDKIDSLLEVLAPVSGALVWRWASNGVSGDGAAAFRSAAHWGEGDGAGSARRIKTHCTSITGFKRRAATVPRKTGTTKSVHPVFPAV